MKPGRRLNLLRKFGFKVFAADFLASNIRLPKLTARYKDKVLTGWLSEHYGHVINRYRQKTESHPDKCDSSPCIWSMWWQGEDNAPEIVRMCFASIRKHCGFHKFIVITKDNYSDYVDMPEYIFRKKDEGIITLTHLSDITRMYLLARHGGMWLDSTVLVTENIPDEIFSMYYYTIRRGFDVHDFNTAMKRWNICVQKAEKGCTLCEFVLDMWLEYWKDNDTLIDYVLMDYIIAAAYELLPECRAMIEAVPLGNYAFDDMIPLLNDEWDSDVFDKMAKDTQFFKLTYKHTYSKAKHGQDTFYGHFIRSMEVKK